MRKSIHPRKPSSVRVGHRDMSVAFVSRDAMPDADGDFTIDAQAIRVGDWLAPQTQAEVLIHELLHACWPYRWNACQRPDDIEEDLVTLLAPQLAGVLRDNPSLVLWLTQSLEGDNA